MKKIYSLLFSIISSLSFAQDLQFDPIFNSGTPHSDADLSFDQDLSEYNYGGVKKLNDSVFIYYRNYVNWNNEEVFSDVYFKTVSSTGSVSYDYIYTSQNSFAQNGPDLFTVSDIVIANARVYILQNQAYDDNGNTKNGIYVHAYDYSNGTFNPSTWASSGGAIQVTENIMNAKGVELSFGILTLAFASSNGGPWQISSTSVGSVAGNISFGGVTTLTNNTTGMSSEVADILFVSANELYIADNAYSCSGGNCNDMVRVIKYNPSTFSLASDYTAGGTGFSQTMNWNSQTNTPTTQDRIKKILYQNGKIIVVGDYNHYDGSPYALSKGRITRLNSNGSIDNTFAVNSSISGTFTNNFNNDYFRWEFNDIDQFSTGDLFISANGNFGSGPSDPNQCFFIKLNANGELDSSVGNSGRLFENQGYNSIKETIILPGSSALNDKFMFNGLRQLNPGIVTTMGRLVWSSGGTSNLTETEQNAISIYPNPTQEILNVSLSEASAIVVTDINGKRLIKLQTSNSHVINVADLESGVYFIHTDNGATTRFIKN